MKNVKEFLRRWQCDELDKLKRYLIIPLLLFICNVTDIDAQIRYIEKNREWVLETNAMTYKLGIIDDQVFSLYYGSKIGDTLIIPWVKRKEVAVRGGIVNKTPAIEVIFNDGTRDLDLRFLKSEILSDGEEQILRIDQKDSFYPIIVSSFYKILPDHDITKWNSEDVKVATEKIKFYKQIREITHNGILFRLKSPFESNNSILQYINPEKTEIVIFCYQLEDPLRGSSTYPFRNDVIILRGLNPDKTYLLQGSGKKYSGRDLMDQGFTFPLDMSYSSTILKFTAE